MKKRVIVAAIAAIALVTLLSPVTRGQQGFRRAPGAVYDVDFVSASESSLAGDTYAAVTSRSYHQACVNVLLMDGSVRTVKNGINQATWRALGTRNGMEIVGDDY